MAFTIPNSADAAFADQAAPDSRDFGDILAAAANLTGVVSGCAVTAQGSPDMTVAVAAGTVSVGGTQVAVSAGNVTITAADGTNLRFDLICVDSAGTKSAVAGTPAAIAVFPDPAGKTVLAAVRVPASATAINANQIVDKRVIVDVGTIANSGSSSVFQATAYGTAVFGSTLYRAARGTAAAPLRAKSADVLGRLAAVGARAADDVSAATFPTGGKGRIDILAAEDQTTAANGTRIDFYTTPIGSTTPVWGLRLDSTGILYPNFGVSLTNLAAGSQSLKDELGTALSWGALRTPLRWALAVGSDAAPVTAAGNPIKVSKTENIATGVLTSDQSSDENAAFSAYSRGLATTQVQVAALHGFARSLSTQSGFNDDSCGVLGIGLVSGAATGNGIGGYFHGRCEAGTNASAGALGAELRVENFKAEDHSYNPSGFSKSTGLWITAYDNAATHVIGVGIALGRFGPTAQYDVGLGFNQGVVKTTTIRDDSDSITAYKVNGSHTTGIDLSGATFAGAAVQTASGHMIQGGAVMWNRIPAGDIVVPASYAMVVPSDFEVPSGNSIELAADAVMEVL